MIARTISRKSQTVLTQLYKSLVRPHLEYCYSASHPKTNSYWRKSTIVFPRMFPDLKKLAHEERLKKLNLWTLEERRNRADMIETFKIIKWISNVPLEAFFEIDIQSRLHRLKLVKTRSATNARLHSLPQRVVNRWNSLPKETANVETTNSFKSHLQKMRQTRMNFFMDNWCPPNSNGCGKFTDYRWGLRADTEKHPGPVRLWYDYGSRLKFRRYTWRWCGPERW